MSRTRRDVANAKEKRIRRARHLAWNMIEEHHMMKPPWPEPAAEHEAWALWLRVRELPHVPELMPKGNDDDIWTVRIDAKLALAGRAVPTPMPDIPTYYVRSGRCEMDNGAVWERFVLDAYVWKSGGWTQVPLTDVMDRIEARLTLAALA